MSTQPDMDEYIFIRDAMHTIQTLELTDFVKEFRDEGGFMWSVDKRVATISNALEYQSHSGASFACTLRSCQYYFTHPDDWSQLQKLYERTSGVHIEEANRDMDETSTNDTDLFFEAFS